MLRKIKEQIIGSTIGTTASSLAARLYWDQQEQSNPTKTNPPAISVSQSDDATSKMDEAEDEFFIVENPNKPKDTLKRKNKPKALDVVDLTDWSFAEDKSPTFPELKMPAPDYWSDILNEINHPTEAKNSDESSTLFDVDLSDLVIPADLIDAEASIQATNAEPQSEVAACLNDICQQIENATKPTEAKVSILTANSISDEGAAVLAQALKIGPVLQKLDLDPAQKSVLSAVTTDSKRHVEADQSMLDAKATKPEAKASKAERRKAFFERQYAEQETARLEKIVKESARVNAKIKAEIEKEMAKARLQEERRKVHTKQQEKFKLYTTMFKDTRVVPSMGHTQVIIEDVSALIRDSFSLSKKM